MRKFQCLLLVLKRYLSLYNLYDRTFKFSFKSCSQRVRGLRWQEPPKMVSARNKAQYLSSVNHFAKIINHFHHYHQHKFPWS